MRADAEGQTALRLRQGAQRAEKLDRAVPGRFVTGEGLRRFGFL